MCTCTACGLSPVQLCLRTPILMGLCYLQSVAKSPAEKKSMEIVVIWFSFFLCWFVGGFFDPEECTFLGYTLNCQEAKSTLGILHGAWKVVPQSLATQSFSLKSSSCFSYLSKLCININILLMGKYFHITPYCCWKEDSWFRWEWQSLCGASTAIQVKGIKTKKRGNGSS